MEKKKIKMISKKKKNQFYTKINNINVNKYTNLWQVIYNKILN